MTVRPARIRRGALALVAVAAVAVVAVVGVRSTQTTASDVSVAGAESVTVPLAPLDLESVETVLVFGDSWTYGSAASDPTLGYAYLLADLSGWEVSVEGVRGSGYLKQGIDGGTVGERIAELDADLDPDLVIVQGSINDRKQDLSGYRDAVIAAWDAFAALYPDATFVILGPAPQVLPVEEATAAIDTDLAELAAARGWHYVSPIQDDWITPANYFTLIDTGAGNDHPSDAGHEYLARRLYTALQDAALAGDVAAEAPAP